MTHYSLTAIDIDGIQQIYDVQDNGTDIVTDFSATNSLEKLDLSGITAIADMDDLLGIGGAAQGQGNDVLIDTGSGNFILLENVRLTDLDVTDFIF